MDIEQRQNLLRVEIPEITVSDSIAPNIKNEQTAYSAVVSILKTQNLISLLQSKPSHSRTEKDIKSISQLLKYQPYFSAVSRNPKMLYEISTWIQYKKVQYGSKIYRIGDPSECFYVLLKGQVQLSYPEKVSQNKQEQNQNQQLFSPDFKRMMTQPPLPSPPSTLNIKSQLSTKQQQQSSKKKTMKKFSIPGQQIIIVPLTPPKPKVQIEEERIVRIVNQGQSFGDLGEVGRRGTNAIANETCYLLVIKKQHYSQIQKAQLKSEGKKTFQFMSNIPFFKLLYRYSLESIIYFLQQHKVRYNSIIYNQEDLIKYVYIIYKGQFKLYKKINSKKQQRISTLTCQGSKIQDIRTPQRNVSFKIIQLGELLGYTQVFYQYPSHLQTCVCKSQQGVVLRIDKKKFLKNIFTSDNNLQDITNFVKEKHVLKDKQVQQFLQKHQHNQLYVRYLHTPSARSRRVRTQSVVQKQKQDKKKYLRRLSTAHDNFFNKINETVTHQPNTRRISINRILKAKQQQKQIVPSGIRDIVDMVKHQVNYHKIRKPQQNVTLFQFNISKVPLHIKKKYDFLFKKPNK